MTENGVGSVVAGSPIRRERLRKRGKKRLRPFTVDGVGLHPKAPSFEVDGDSAIEGKIPSEASNDVGLLP